MAIAVMTASVVHQGMKAITVTTATTNSVQAAAQTVIAVIHHYALAVHLSALTAEGLYVMNF